MGSGDTTRECIGKFQRGEGFAGGEILFQRGQVSGTVCFDEAEEGRGEGSVGEDDV
jgi:hypothetical protein